MGIQCKLYFAALAKKSPRAVPCDCGGVEGCTHPVLIELTAIERRCFPELGDARLVRVSRTPEGVVTISALGG